VLVLGNRIDLFEGKVAERDAVFKRQHGETFEAKRCPRSALIAMI
jgi:hypothetical protein